MLFLSTAPVIGWENQTLASLAFSSAKHFFPGWVIFSLAQFPNQIHCLVTWKAVPAHSGEAGEHALQLWKKVQVPEEEGLMLALLLKEAIVEMQPWLLFFFFFVCIHKELWEIVLMHMDQGCYLHPWVGNTANPGNFSDFLTLVSLPEVDRTIRCRWLSRSAAWGYPTTLSPQSKAGCSTNSGNWHKNYHLHFTVEVQQADCSTSHKLYMGHWSWTASPAFSLFASFCLAWFTPLWSALLIPNVL